MSEYRTVLGFDGLPTDLVVLRIVDGAYIPADPANTDYQRYLDWLAAGNKPEIIEG